MLGSIVGAEEAPTETTPAPSPLGSLTDDTAIANANASEAPAEKDTLSVDFDDDEIRNILVNVANLFRVTVSIPDELQGRTTIRLRDVSWRQVYQVVLASAGYDYYELNKVIVIRKAAEIAALPAVSRTHELFYQTPEETVTYMTRRYKSDAVFTAAPNAIVYKVHPKRLAKIKAELDRIDLPTVRLNPFPSKVFLPATLPDLSLVPDPISGLSKSVVGPLSTEVYILKWVDAEAVAPYLEREFSAPGSRVVTDRVINGLIVSAPRSTFPRLQAIVEYLDDKRWYTPPEKVSE